MESTIQTNQAKHDVVRGRVDAELKAKVAARAKELDRNESWVVREALRRFLDIQDCSDAK